MQSRNTQHRARRKRLPSSPGVASLVALMTCASLLVGWSTSRGFTQPPGRFGHPIHRRAWWIGSRLGPAWHTANLKDSSLVFVGDSRLKLGIDLPLAASLGVDSASKIWRAGARTADLLRPLLEWEVPRSLVVSLTPLGFDGLPNKVVAETLRTFNPACDPTVPPWRVKLWTHAEQDHLVEQGFHPKLVGKTMEWWIGKHKVMREDYLASQRVLNTRRIDQDLNGYVDRQRSLWLHPMEPLNWPQSWWRRGERKSSDAQYKHVLSGSKRKGLQKGYRDLQQILQSLIERGWHVAAVRLPIEPGLRRIEEESVAAGWVDQLVRELDVPYLDMGGWPDSTLDGSHLHMAGAAKATTEVSLWIQKIWPTSR